MANIIIGAGPSGLNTAYNLAKQDCNVKVFEEHPKMGLPFQCAGIVTSELERFVSLDRSFLLNKIISAEIIINNKIIHFNFSKPNIILDRPRFDQYLAKRAENAGAEIFVSHKYISNTGTACTIKNLRTKKTIIAPFANLIGADGPSSPVASHNNLKTKNDFWIGIQARAYLVNDNQVKFFPNIGACAWIVPENKDIVRIGLFGMGVNLNKVFQDFLKSRNIKKVIDYQVGLIPKFTKQLIQKNNIFLVGDAASQVKATTGGGIVQGLTASNYLADAILNKTSYSKACKGLDRDLWLHLQIRKMLDSLQTKDWNALAQLFSNRNLAKVLENHEREYPSKFLLRMFLKEPKLVLFGFSAFFAFLKQSFYK